jgi:Ca2+-binding RTX toxin-like protein
VLTSPLPTPPVEAPPMTRWNEDGALLVRGSFVAEADLKVRIIAADKVQSDEPVDIIGNGFAQRITGTHGANVLNGGGGGDTLVGMMGDDTYLVNDPRDRIVEANGEGLDTVYTITSYNLGEDEVEVLSTVYHVDTTPIDLIGNFASQRVIGNYGANVLNGGSGGIDTLIGLFGDDTYAVGDSRTVVIERAGQGFDVLVTSVNFLLSPDAEIEVFAAQDRSSSVGIRLGGNGYAQTIAGTEGADTIAGGGGADLLIGGGGTDRFDLEIGTTPSGSPSIADFSSGVDRLGIIGRASDLGDRLDAAEFVVGAAATTAAHRIVYDQATGGLFYDADGSGGGGSVLIARLTAGTTLSLGDFEMVAPTATTT